MSDDTGPEQPTAGRNRGDESGCEDKPGPMAGDSLAGDAADARVYRVDVTGARGVLVGDGSMQHNYFQFFGTWTDGVAPQPLAGTSGQVESPYRGLEAFREADAGFFFGRDTAIREVLSRLSGCLAGTGLLVVSGVSGAGKTSLLRAGVLRELRRAGLPSEPAAARWPCVVLVPGGSPLNELALAIAPAAGADAAAVRQSLAANPADFALTARQAAQFSGTASAGRAQDPGSGGPRAVKARNSVGAGTGANDPGAGLAAGERRVLLVVDQFETVFTLCDRDEERAAFLAALCAQAAYAPLTAAQQAVAQQVFTRLTATTADGIDTAVRATRAELLAGQDGPAVADVETVLTAFAAKRLLTLAADTVEISHEVLLSAWPLLRDDWLAATRADRAARARLQVTVTEWLASGLDRSFLYNGSQLNAASRAADRIAADGRQTSLSREERAFLAASRRAAERATRIRRAAVAGIAVLAAGLAVALVIATTSASGFLRERDQALKAGQSAEAELAKQTSGLLASESLPLQTTDPLTAAKYSVLAWALNPRSPQARYALQSSAADPLTAVFRDSAAPVLVIPQSVAFSPDGKTLAVSGYGEDHAWARLWNLTTDSETGGPLTVGSTTGLLTIATPEAFSTDGKSLIVADSLQAVRWNTATGREAAAFSVSTAGAVTSMALSPDGKTLAVGGLLCECVQLRNAATGQQIGTPLAPGRRAAFADATGNVLAAFSRAGKTLVTAGPDGRVRLWNVATHQQEGPAFPALARLNESLAVSPDGTILATGQDDGTVRLWDAATGQQIGQPLIAGANKGAQVKTVAFSPDGSMIAAGDQNGTVRVWSAATQRQIGPVLSGGVDTVNAVAFSPDSRELASADNDGSVRLWNLTALAGLQAAPPVPGGEGISADGGGAFALGPDEKLATSDETNNVTIWQPVAGHERGYLSSTVPNPSPPTETGGGVDLALSPDGKTLATGANDGSVRLWNLPAGLTAGTPARTIPPPVLPSSAPTVQHLVFSPNGRQLAVSYATGTVVVFGTATGQPTAGPQAAGSLPGGILALGFTPGEASVLIANANGYVTTWNLTTNATSSSHFPPISNLTWPTPTAFSPDGTTIAVAPSDTVRLWNVSYLTPVGALAELCARIRPTMSAPPDWTAPQQTDADMSYQRACVTDG